MNCTPFVRQYDILSNKWGVLLCQKEYQTDESSSESTLEQSKPTSESAPEESSSQTNESTPTASNTNGKNLVVYFSMPDNVDDSTVVIDGETLGNTQYMAYGAQRLSHYLHEQGIKSRAGIRDSESPA